MKIRFLTVADQEVDDAVAWYAQLGTDLSRGFLDDLDRAVRLAKNYPLSATQIEPEILWLTQEGWAEESCGAFGEQDEG